MKSYIWRKNFSATCSNQEWVMRGKLAFKTETTHWLNTEAPVLIPISVHSNFHEGLDGELKMNALISTIKNHVKGKITILLTEKAHLNVASLKYGNDQEAFEECLKDARRLVDRFKSYFEQCHLNYWDSYICEDPSYPLFRDQMREQYLTDEKFRNLVHQDAEMTYTSQRALEYPDQNLFINKAIEDLLEQCVCLLVITHKGYRFQFYPGNSFASTDYVNRTLLPKENQISCINVFLTIEKKTIIHRNL